MIFKPKFFLKKRKFFENFKNQFFKTKQEPKIIFGQKAETNRIQRKLVELVFIFYF